MGDGVGSKGDGVGSKGDGVVARVMEWVAIGDGVGSYR